MAGCGDPPPTFNTCSQDYLDGGAPVINRDNVEPLIAEMGGVAVGVSGELPGRAHTEPIGDETTREKAAITAGSLFFNTRHHNIGPDTFRTGDPKTRFDEPREVACITADGTLRVSRDIVRGLKAAQALGVDVQSAQFQIDRK